MVATGNCSQLDKVQLCFISPHLVGNRLTPSPLA